MIDDLSIILKIENLVTSLDSYLALSETRTVLINAVKGSSPGVSLIALLTDASTHLPREDIFVERVGKISAVQHDENISLTIGARIRNPSPALVRFLADRPDRQTDLDDNAANLVFCQRATMAKDVLFHYIRSLPEPSSVTLEVGFKVRPVSKSEQPLFFRTEQTGPMGKEVRRGPFLEPRVVS